MKYSIGVDIGGTKINFTLLKDWKEIKQKRKKVYTPKTKKRIIKIVEDNIKDLIIDIPKSDILGIGIGVPTILDQKKETVLPPPNLKVLSGCALAKIIEKDLKIKTVLENDANCFTLAEAMIGAGKGCSSILGITVGTGIGGGIVFKRNKNYRIYHGFFGRAGEIGHMIINFDGVNCSCGNKGCFEEYASEKFISKKSKFSSIELENMAKKGNRKAKDIYNEFSRNLGIGLASLINVLDPEVIVIGGGFAKASALILKPVKKEVKKRVFLTRSKRFANIRIARLGEFAGAVGAALLFKIKN